MKAMKRIYVAPCMKSVPLGTKDDVTVIITESQVDPTDPGFEWGVKEEFEEWDKENGPSYDGSSDIWDNVW